MAASDSTTDDSLYPIAVLIDELKNEDVQVIKKSQHQFFNKVSFIPGGLVFISRPGLVISLEFSVPVGGALIRLFDVRPLLPPSSFYFG